MRLSQTLALVICALLTISCVNEGGGGHTPCVQSCHSTEQCGAGEVCVAACCVALPDMGCQAMGDDVTCDGIDDDCDGHIDEAWAGVESCGLGPCAASAAPATCEGGVETACQPGPHTGERCNGVDDDCDGAADENFELEHDVDNCGACGRTCDVAGAVAFCRDGDCGISACLAGFHDCNSSAGDGCESEGPCSPDSECDGDDDDDDGAIDEAYVPDSSCGRGACRAGNTPSACVDGDVKPCEPGPPAAGEACDGRDEDCDGAIDEGLGVGESCTVGVGFCAASGRMVCSANGAVECDAIPRLPLPEDRCDGVDGDCDGALDEDHVSSGGAACPGVTGVCAGNSVIECRDGAEVCVPGDAADEVCNALDDDCDGRYDEQMARWAAPVYLPFARRVDGEPRRAVRANMAWKGDALAIVWSEDAIDTEGESSQGALTVIDTAGRPMLAPPTRLIDDGPITSPYITQDGDQWLIAWTDFDDDLVKFRRSLDGSFAEPIASLYGGTSGNLRAITEGPAGPLLAWYALAEGHGAASFEEWIGPPSAEPMGAAHRLTDNILPDRTARLASAPDRVGVAWTRNEFGGGRTLRFRLTDPHGRPLSDEIPVAELGPAGASDVDVAPTMEHDITWTGRGFLITWIAEDAGSRQLYARLVGRDGRALGGAIDYERRGIRSPNFPALWVPALESTVVAWSEEIDGGARIHAGLIDPLTGDLTQVEPLPVSAGEQLNPSDLAWKDGRVAVVWEEKRAEGDWRPAISFGEVGCGRDRCEGGPQPQLDGVCDGIDADCDGRLDEDYIAVESCGVGRCRLESEPSICLAGFEIGCEAADPVEETCGNALDDDCDQRTDEGCNGCPEGTIVPDGWVCAPAGRFVMGSGEGEFDRDDGFEDRREITLSRPFLVTATEITQHQWRALMGNNPSTMLGGDAHPVDSVTWWDAAAYADALSRAHGLEPCHDVPVERCDGTPGEGDGLTNCPLRPPPSPACTGYRLPTEAEWEYVARAGTQTAFWWGNRPARDDCARTDEANGLAWSCSNSDLNERFPGSRICTNLRGRSTDFPCGTHPVGDRIGMEPSPWGLYDVHGNVAEWVADWWDSGFVERDLRDPVGPSEPEVAPAEQPAALCPLNSQINGSPMPCKGYRGGAYGSATVDQRAAKRRWVSPSRTSDGRGFRVVRTLPAP